MKKLSARTELLLNAMRFVNASDPVLRREIGEHLAFVTTDYITDPKTDTSLRYTLQLAYAVQKVIERSQLDWPRALPALQEILDLACKEGRADDAGAAIEISAGMRQWQQRADLR